MNDADSFKNVHVVDDFKSEMKEVEEKFYLMSALTGPIDPLLDKADENHIFDKADYQEICGRSIKPEEYEQYCIKAKRLQRDCLLGLTGPV